SVPHDDATSHAHTLSLHDALPIYAATCPGSVVASRKPCPVNGRLPPGTHGKTGTPASANSRAAPENDDASAARAHTPVNTSGATDRKSTRLNSSHVKISYAVFCLK